MYISVESLKRSRAERNRFSVSICNFLSYWFFFFKVIFANCNFFKINIAAFQVFLRLNCHFSFVGGHSCHFSFVGGHSCHFSFVWGHRVTSRLFKVIVVTSRLFKVIAANSRLFEDIVTTSHLFEDIVATSRLFEVIVATSRLFKVIVATGHFFYCRFKIVICQFIAQSCWLSNFRLEHTLFAVCQCSRRKICNLSVSSWGFIGLSNVTQSYTLSVDCLHIRHSTV